MLQVWSRWRPASGTRRAASVRAGRTSREPLKLPPDKSIIGTSTFTQNKTPSNVTCGARRHNAERQPTCFVRENKNDGAQT